MIDYWWGDSALELSAYSNAFSYLLEYLLWPLLKASMPDGKDCYTPIGDTGIPP